MVVGTPFFIFIEIIKYALSKVQSLIIIIANSRKIVHNHIPLRFVSVGLTFYRLFMWMRGQGEELVSEWIRGHRLHLTSTYKNYIFGCQFASWDGDIKIEYTSWVKVMWPVTKEMEVPRSASSNSSMLVAQECEERQQEFEIKAVTWRIK